MEALSAIGYSFAALSFAVLSVLLLTSWTRPTQGSRLIVACIATTAWALLLARNVYNPVPIAVIYLCEIARIGTWLWALTGIAREGVPRYLGITANALWIGALVLNGVVISLARMGWFEPTVSDALFLTTGLVLSLTGLVLLEQLYRNATQTAPRSLRYFVVGAGIIFAYNLFLYAQGQLLHAIPAFTWALRGMVATCSVPLFALAARKNEDWSVDLFVSRQVVFHTATFVAVGVYLSLMALGGYYVRFVEAEWATLAQLVFFAGAGLILVWLLSSAAVKRQIKVFISKHFYSNKYDYRLQWLQFAQKLSNDNQEVARTAIRAVAQVFDSPGGVLYWRDETRDFFVPAATWTQGSADPPACKAIDRREELVGFLGKRHWIIDVSEYKRTPDLYENIYLPSWLTDDARIRIISPILYLGKLRGFFVLLEPPAPFELTYEDRDLLRTLGINVAMYVAQYEASQKLAESRQFEVFSRLTAFMMHDLKNAVAQLSLVVSNAERHRHKPEFFDDAISTIANAAGRIEHLILQLRGAPAAERVQDVLLDNVIDQAVARCLGRAPRPVAHFAGEDLWVRADQERLTSVLEHLLRNAQDATPEQGKVRIELVNREGTACISVSDNGSGMAPDFVRERLFRPFDTTKGTRGMGIGAYQAREYIQSIGGELIVDSSVGEGTCIEVHLPLIEHVSPSLASAGH